MGSTLFIVVGTMAATSPMDTDSGGGNSINVTVLYCGAWSYVRKATKLKKELDTSFPGRVVFSKERSTTQGMFDVAVEGAVVHSKQGGDGFVDDTEKLNRIIDAVRQAIGS